jgi:uridine kinase
MSHRRQTRAGVRCGGRLVQIYLLKVPYRAHYDLSVWIECSFETALARAMARSQEGLSPEETVRAYQTIYFPAQATHFERHRPYLAVDLIRINDARGGPAAAA